MAKRKIIKIDADKCTGCAKCIPDCPEGALQMIDGKARLISDLFCDGLGACIGSCPEGAITVEEREAEKYNEKKVMENIVKQGKNTIIAHLKHLKDHGETKYLKEAMEFLKEKGIEVPKDTGAPCACPGTKTMDFSQEEEEENAPVGKQPSALRQWPLQLKLVSPLAPYFQGKDVILCADCVAYAIGDFHASFLKGKSLAIACPKLDENVDIYIDKITTLIDQAKINTLTVMTMEVPCCAGLLAIAKEGASKASRKIPIKSILVGLRGKVLKEEWVKI